MAAQDQPVMNPIINEMEEECDLGFKTTPQIISHLKSSFDAEFARMACLLLSRENILRRELQTQTNQNKRSLEVEAIVLLREERLRREIESKSNEIESIRQQHEKEKDADRVKSRNEMLELKEKDLLLEKENSALMSQVHRLTKKVSDLETALSNTDKDMHKAKEKILMRNVDEEDIMPFFAHLATSEEVLKRKRESETSPKSGGAFSNGLANSSTRVDSEKGNGDGKEMPQGIAEEELQKHKATCNAANKKDPTGKSHIKNITSTPTKRTKVSSSDPSNTGNESDAHMTVYSIANKSSSEKSREIVAEEKEKALMRDLSDNTLKVDDFNVIEFVDLLEEECAPVLKNDKSEKNVVSKIMSEASPKCKGKRKRVSEASPKCAKSGNASSRGLEKSSTKAASEKDKVHNLPSDEDLKDAISDILKVVDFDTTTSTDIKKQLALKFKTDFTEKFPLIKIMIHKEIEILAKLKSQDHKVKEGEAGSGKEKKIRI